MNNLLVVLAYCPKDLEITKKLLFWISELGSCKPHSLLLVADSAVPQPTMRELMDIVRPVFHKVHTMIVTVPSNVTFPPNHMFLQAANQVKENYKHDFLWMEPDSIPIGEEWLEEIAMAYDDCPSRFMGSIIHQEGQPGMPSDYLNGVAVYPNDAIDLFKNIPTIKDGTQAWDIASASVVIPKAMNTPLIKHFYGLKDLPPVFVASRATDAPKNHVTLDFVPKEAAIFHRSKGGELIDLLRAKRNASIPAKSSSPEGENKFSLTETMLAGAPTPNLSAPEIDTPQPQQEKRGVVKSRKVEASV
jgi:hypothetical protein